MKTLGIAIGVFLQGLITGILFFFALMLMLGSSFTGLLFRYQGF